MTTATTTAGVSAYVEAHKPRTKPTVVSTAMIVLGALSTVLLSVALFEVLAPPTMADESWELQVTGAALGWLLVFLACAYARFRSIYLFASCYLLLLCQFHLGITISDAFGLFGDIRWPADLSANWLSLSGWYVVLALAAFGVGFAIAAVRRRRRTVPVDRKTERASRRRGFPLAWWAGLGLFGASVVCLVLAIASVGSLLAYSRADLFRGVGDTRGLGVFLMVFPSALMLLVIGSRAGWQRVAAFGAAIVGLGIVMLSGYRTYALAPLVVGAVVWVKVGRRIPAPLAAAGVAFMVVAISFIGVLRMAGAYGSLNEQKIERAWSQSSAKEAVLLGQTGSLLAQVLRLVPASDPYRYGATYVDALVESVPNIGGQIAESERVLAKRRSMVDPAALDRLPPSDWLTYRLSRWKFNNGQGVGFTTIGEAYLNFGTLGVIAFFLLVGFFFGRLESLDLTQHPWWLLFCCALLWHLTRTVRDEFANFTKPALFTLLILAIWALVGRPLMPRRAVQS